LYRTRSRKLPSKAAFKYTSVYTNKVLSFLNRRDPTADIFAAIMTHDIYLYPGSGSLSGRHGDHVIIAPQYNCTEADVEVLAALTIGAIKMFFEETAR
jgi:hypothetical protein